jgi:hypothetical protein
MYAGRIDLVRGYTECSRATTESHRYTESVEKGRDQQLILESVDTVELYAGRIDLVRRLLTLLEMSLDYL